MKSHCRPNRKHVGIMMTDNREGLWPTCIMLVFPTAGAPRRMTLTRSTDSGLISIGLCCWCWAPSPPSFEVEPAFWRRSRKSRSNSANGKGNPITCDGTVDRGGSVSTVANRKTPRKIDLAEDTFALFLKNKRLCFAREYKGGDFWVYGAMKNWGGGPPTKWKYEL